MQITMQGKYQTRDGRAVRILCTDAEGSRCPVIGLITFPNGECVGFWKLDGTNNSDPDLDLSTAPATKYEATMRWNPHERIPVVQLSNGKVVNLTCFLDLLAEGSATEAHVTWES